MLLQSTFQIGVVFVRTTDKLLLIEVTMNKLLYQIGVEIVNTSDKLLIEATIDKLVSHIMVISVKKYKHLTTKVAKMYKLGYIV